VFDKKVRIVLPPWCSSRLASAGKRILNALQKYWNYVKNKEKSKKDKIR
jgi:hypothetical protein